MPIYHHRSVLDLTRNLRAFLNLNAGLTRGNPPDPEWELRQARSRIEQQNRELKQLRPGKKQRVPEWTESLDKPMKILHISLDDGGSGAGRAAHKLHAGLRRLGHESSMFVAKKGSDDPAVRAFEPSTDQRGRREERRARIEQDFARYSDSRPTRT